MNQTVTAALVPRKRLIEWRHTARVLAGLFSLSGAVGSGHSALAAPPVTSLAQLRQIHSPGAVPTRIRGIVTGLSGWKNSFFLQDATGAISVDRLETAAVRPGDVVEVNGQVRPGQFAPILLSDETRVIGHHSLPVAQKTTYSQLATGAFDSSFVEITGVGRAVREDQIWGRRVLIVDLHTPEGLITAHVLDYAGSKPASLIDSTIRITGVCGTIFNDQQQLVGLRLFVANFGQIAIVKRGPDIASLPVTSLASVRKYNGPDLEHRIKISGTVTYQGTDKDLYLQDGMTVARVETLDRGNWPPGARVNASGFIVKLGHLLTLSHALVEQVGSGFRVQPAHLAATDVIHTADGFVQAPFNGRLIQLDGQIVELLPNSETQVWAVRSGKVQFEAQLSHALSRTGLALEPDTIVRLTGVCVADEDENQNPKSFRILLRSPQDAVALNTPHWRSSLIVLVTILALIVLGSAGLWLVHKSAEEDSFVGIEATTSTRRRLRFQQLSNWLAVLSIAIATPVVIGWVLDIRALQLHDSFSPMMPNAAASILFAGMAVLFLRRKTPRPLSLGCSLGGWFTAAIGAFSILEYATSWNLRFDGLLIGNLAVFSGVSSPGRMALATAFCLLLSGSAIGLHFRKGSIGPGQVLAIASGVISMLNATSYLYGTQARYGPGAHLTMAIPTAIALIALNLATLFSQPDRGLMRTISVSASGGLMARRMIPIAILCPTILGFIQLQGELMGMFDMRFGLSLFALSNIVCFGFVIWGSAAALNRLDATRSRAEKDLKERDRRLELVFETASIGDWTWDVVKDEVTAHPVVWKLYGDPNHRGGAPTNWFEQRQHPEDRATITSAVAAAVRNGKLELEFRVIHPDGTVHWIACYGTTLCSASGELLRVNGINFDITNQKLAELQLRESEEQFRKLADALPQIVWTSKADGTIAYYNQRWYEYTGSVFETPWPESVHPDDVAPCQAVLANAMANGLAYEVEIRIRRARDQQYRWHLARSIPVRNAAREIERWFGTSTDIDDVKRATAEILFLNQTLEARVQERSAQLAESERRHRILVDGVKDYAILMLDQSGNVTSWNSGAERILGYTAGEILGKHFSLFYTEDDRQAAHPEKELAIACQTGRFEEEGLRVNKDGNPFWANDVITPLWNERGVLRGFSKVTRDISDRKRAEELVKSRNEQLAEANRELIKQSGRAEEGSRAKSDFLAAMSHEIRTPMNAILGMADLLWETELNVLQKDYVGRFRRAGASLLALLNDILDLSKIESGRFELESIDFNLPDVVERTAELMFTRARMKNVELSARVLPGVPEMVVGDPGRLQQILNNLLGNAVKFTEQGSISLTVQTHPDHLPGHLLFVVQDTGIGIPAGKMAMIFEDFSQAESSTTRRFGGTGLGLGICRRLVHRMGGELTVQSVLGEGSTFSFDVTLPPSKLAVKASAKEAADFGGRRVLIVDDNSTNRLILRQMCKGWGLVPCEADAISQAVDLLRNAHAEGKEFSLVLLDLIMPGVARMDTLNLIRTVNPAVPIILISSDDQPGNITKARSMGAAYLTKPIRSTQLLTAVSETLGDSAVAVPAPVGPVAPSPERNGGDDAFRILVADDSEDNRFLLAAYLKNRSYELTFADNGQQAVEIFASRKFDLVLMDVQMPVMDGLRATAAIRDLEQKRQQRSTAIVALTANALTEDSERSRAAGCTAHLTKPISKEKLITAVETFRRAHAALHPGSQPAPEEKADHVMDIPEGFDELSRHYIISRRKELSNLMHSISDANLPDLRVFGHNMKGTGESFGFAELSRLGAAIEAAAKQSNIAAIKEYLAQVNQYVEFAWDVLS